MANQANRKTIKSVGKVFDIIETIYQFDRPGVTDIADHLDLSKSTVHSHLSTLKKNGYVIQDNGYRLSLKFLTLGGYLQQSDEYRQLYQVAKPELDDLAEQTGERAALMVEENGKGYFLYMVEGQRAVSTDSHLGWEFPLHSTSCGKAYLSELPKHEVKAIVDQHGLPAITENTITDRTRLFEELEDIGRRGTAFDKGERLPGIYCVAVPITTEDDRLICSISLSLPANRADSERFRSELPEHLSSVARVIGLNMMYY